jgi:OmpA-OmpF porin, OOP family
LDGLRRAIARLQPRISVAPQKPEKSSEPQPFAVGRDEMAMFESEIEDVAGRFGLGAKAGPLLREVVQLITGSPGGIAGFIDKFKSAGLGSQVASWLGTSDGAALSASQVENSIGGNVLRGIASRLGVAGSVAGAAIGYLLPKVIGQMTPGGTVPTATPSWVPGYLGQAVTRRVEQVAPAALNVIPDAPHLGRWLIPVLAGLGVLGLIWYLLSGVTPTQVATAPTAPAAVPPPAPVPTVPAHLALSNDAGMITYSGAVNDEATRTSIINSLKAVFGDANVKGNITVDANAGPAPWLVNLRTGLETLKTPGVQADFNGESVKIGGLIENSDRDRIINSLRSIFGTGLVFGALSDRMGDLISAATNRTEAALSSLRKGFSATDLTAVLNQSIINFPTNSAEIPAISKPLLQQAANAIRQLPTSTVIEIGGYTDNVGDSAANLQLSQERADAVRAALIEAGVDPSMLVAKGYGSASPVAGNDTLEGRLRNRRIEYRVVNKA